ncbi:MAG: hypothetical protein GY716_03555 [bacterium]|nr:hypothetical protein [bacterium]
METADKQTLVAELRARVELEMQSLRESQRAAQDGAIHEEARQEDPKDTRAIEAQYIARGLAERVETLQGTLAALAQFRLDGFGPDDPVGLSALVALHDGDDERVYFLVPVGGGEALEANRTTVRTLTPASPLGRAITGKCVGDDVELELPGRRLDATIEWVR